jgi:cob(I)alamin adenosyltransferase
VKSGRNPNETSDSRLSRNGLVVLYTGEGKGKTTAALGLALRACGHGRRVLMVCFMKGNFRVGEIRAVENLPGFTLVLSGRSEFVDKRDPDPRDIHIAREGLKQAGEAVEKGNIDLLILDEAHVALDYGLLDLQDILNLIEIKPPEMDLILTGRNAPVELVKRADLVSEVLNIKHPFQKGIPAQAGIDF